LQPGPEEPPSIDIPPIEWLEADVAAAATLPVVLDAAVPDTDMLMEVLMIVGMKGKWRRNGEENGVKR